MVNTYLLDIIKALEPAERQEMLLFLASPHFNQGSNAKELTILYKFILSSAPTFSAEKIKKEAAYREIYPKGNMVAGKMNKLMTELNKLLRVFILTKKQLALPNEEQQQLDWAVWLREHGLVNRAFQVLAKLKKSNGLSRMESLEWYQIRMLIAKEVHEWESIQNQVKGDLGIPDLMYRLDLYYYTFRTELENRYFLQQKGAQLPDLDLMQASATYYQDKSILLQISKSVNEILKNDAPSVSEFQGLMHLLQQHEGTLSFQTLAQNYTYLRGACTMLINSGHLEFAALLHQINKDNLAQGLFFIHGEISPNVYINLVQVAIRAKDLSWAYEFSEQYKNRIIGGDEGQFFYRFNLSHCFFATGKFDEALGQLPDAFANSHYHHIIRRLEVKIYYELHSESELFAYKLDAFRKFVERTAPKIISSNLRKMDLNFFNTLNQFCKTTKKGKAIADRLVERIEKKQLVSDRAWLIEKAKEFE